MDKHVLDMQVCPRGPSLRAVLLPGLCPSSTDCHLSAHIQCGGSTQLGIVSSELQGCGWQEGFLQLLLALED